MRTIIILLTILPLSVFAQPLNYYLGNEYNLIIGAEINHSQNSVHTGFKPIVKNKTNEKIDSVLFDCNRDVSILNKMKYTWFWRKMRTEDFIHINKKDFGFSLNPLIYYETGKMDNYNSKLNINTRGIEMHGHIGGKFAFFTSFYENQAFFRPYITQKILETSVVPGQGAPKIFEETGQDYSMSSGYISYSPWIFLNIQLGHGKHFVGEGYRSLLLSDNSFNYPYLKFTINYCKFQYNRIYSQFMDFQGKYYSYHFTKHATFNYLSWSPLNFIELGLFEGTIFRTSDDSTYVKKLNINYYNPIIMINTFRYGLDNKNNVLLGFNAKIKILNQFQLYGQFALDNFDKHTKSSYQDKYSFQTGLKIYDLMFNTIRKSRLYIQLEYNYSNPYTYSHENNHQSWSHYNQALSHPLGAGFSELVAIGALYFHDFFIEIRLNNATLSRDTSGTNFGTDIFQINSNASFTENTSIGQGVKSTLNHQYIKVGFIINHKTRLQLFAGMDTRKSDQEKTVFVFFGIKTALENYYFDF